MLFRSPQFLLLSTLLCFTGMALAESGGEAPSGITLEKLKRSSQKKADKNLFTAKTWGATARRPSQSNTVATVTQPIVTPVAPVAPPMPFSYMGKMFDEESGKLILYLAKGDIPYSVSVGEVIDGTYQVEAVTETVLTLIYLPLNTKQILIIGENNS